MKVKDVMTPHAKSIWLTESLADAAQIMWQNDCGVLPVIKDGQKVIGMITDRDICMASAMQNKTPSSISIEEVMTGEVYAVQPEDDIEMALETMSEKRVRRLPVITADGELAGILSVNDLVRRAEPVETEDAIKYVDVVKTYQTICSPPELPKAEPLKAEAAAK